MTPEQEGRGEEHLNVRGRLVGEEEAADLGVEDDPREGLATMGLGALLVLMSVVVLWQAFTLPSSNLPLEPADAPTLVGFGLLVVGILLTAAGRRQMGTWEITAHRSSAQWLRLLVLLGLLIAFALLMPVLGYVVATTVLFGGSAVILGAPYRARMFAYGWIVASAVFLLFDRLIGLALPAGPWGF